MEPRLLWEPSASLKENCNLAQYFKWLHLRKGLFFSEYSTLWQWSITHISDFWKSIIEYFDVQFDGELRSVLSDNAMPGAKWFEEISLSYSEHIFRNRNNKDIAIISGNETGEVRNWTWEELRSQTSALQKLLVDNSIQEGDTVAAYMPCVPEASIAFFAANSLGAVWSSTSPDFGTTAVIDRFAQIKPKVLFVSECYHYNGKVFSKRDAALDLINALSDVQLVVWIGDNAPELQGIKCVRWLDIMSSGHTVSLTFRRVPFSHPIWVLYSSGTTGLPKAITHSTGGILIEQFKYGSFHNDFRAGEHCFWYTTTGWMMWNYIHGSLLAGSTMVLYDGSPAYPDLNVLWKFCAKTKINHFGTSAGFILANMKSGINPSASLDLSSLRSIGSTGSTLPPEGFEWVYRCVKNDVWLASMSGGTDVCSAFVGGNPLWKVWAGEIQCRALGCSLEAWSEDGRSVIDEEGEMVITRPMPSMPVFFWNDPGNKRYKESYFETFNGIWRHGDWIRITPREGVVIYGRSDATLNRGGIRIGTSEIYRAVDQVPEVKDSLIICVEKLDGEFWMPLFIVLNKDVVLNEALIKKINHSIRNANSPRHVPDEIIEVEDIPYTISGKKTETPVKKIIMGRDLKQVSAPGSLRNPDSLSAFLKFRLS